jgi:hypothetical protein
MAGLNALLCALMLVALGRVLGLLEQAMAVEVPPVVATADPAPVEPEPLAGPATPETPAAVPMPAAIPAAAGVAAAATAAVVADTVPEATPAEPVPVLVPEPPPAIAERVAEAPVLPVRVEVPPEIEAPAIVEASAPLAEPVAAHPEPAVQAPIVEDITELPVPAVAPAAPTRPALDLDAFAAALSTAEAAEARTAEARRIAVEPPRAPEPSPRDAFDFDMSALEAALQPVRETAPPPAPEPEPVPAPEPVSLTPPPPPVLPPLPLAPEPEVLAPARPDVTEALLAELLAPPPEPEPEPEPDPPPPPPQRQLVREGGSGAFTYRLFDDQSVDVVMGFGTATFSSPEEFRDFFSGPFQEGEFKGRHYIIYANGKVDAAGTDGLTRYESFDAFLVDAIG